jgi:hypothetical protein
MWIVRLDDNQWLTKNGTTSIESEAWVMPDMPTAQEQLKKTRRLIPYPNAMIAAFNQADCHVSYRLI